MATIFVNGSVTGGSSDGSSWANAYTDLSTALSNAGNGDEIWVAKGTYTPGSAQADTFTINEGIAIYGGFSGNGTETVLEERDFEANATILSGEIGDAGSTSDNIYHVVTAQSTSNQARLDGVIIQGGSTEGVTDDDDNDDGAGVYNQSGGLLILANVVIQNNVAADDGGGIRNDGTLTIYNSTITNNSASGTSLTSGGGGIINTTNGVLTILSSTFSGNSSGRNGGAIRNDGSLTMVGSTLSENSAVFSGGGLINTTGTATIVSSTITRNIATEVLANAGSGAAIANAVEDVSSITIGNSIIVGNTDYLTSSADDLSGAFTSAGNNIVGDGSGAIFFINNDVTGVTDAGLEDLDKNGGFTQTHALKSTSIALDAGSGAIAIALDESTLGIDLNEDGDTNDTFTTIAQLAFDQRGGNFNRVQDDPNDGDSSATVDIGAYELQECFLVGTLILTENGEKPVEELEIGDRLSTLSGQLEPIKWIGRQTYHRATAHPLRSNPIHIKPGALGGNLPHRDLFVSPDHALLVDGLLINAGALTNGTSIIQIQPDEESFTYYHIELQHHALLMAEGTAAESYLPQKQDRETFDNSDEYAVLYPEQTLISLLPMNYPRVSSKRQLPRFVSKRLEKLGRSLYPNVQSA